MLPKDNLGSTIIKPINNKIMEKELEKVFVAELFGATKQQVVAGCCDVLRKFRCSRTAEAVRRMPVDMAYMKFKAMCTL